MWRCKLLLFWCIVVSLALGARSDDSGSDVRDVKTSQGTVRGHKNPDHGVYAFYSIPYATTPTGSQRFKAPLPGPAWLQPLDAVDKHIVCPQMFNPYISSKVMQEECLVASVYVPDTKDKKIPVVVYVHGGAFQIGFGDMIPPFSFVKNKNVIAVTFNYRLGINGFLCLGTKEAPGNAGLKDQLALLRWVKKNIANFGGNPDDITIVGGSAGSVSVDLLMLSKAAKGLFTKVIPESGAAVGAIALQVNPIEDAKNFARNLGFAQIDNFYALQEYFLNSPLDTFYKDTNLFKPNSTFGFTPCVERDTGAEIFLDDAPVNIIKNGKYKKLPMLFGFDEMEGLLQVPKFDEWKGKMNEKFSDFLPVDLQFEDDAEKEKVAYMVKNFYFGDKLVDENSIMGYINFFTDIAFAYPTMLSVKLHTDAGHNQIYLYEYSFVDEDTPIVPHTNLRGATHCAQTLHVMDGRKYMNPLDINESESYKRMQVILQDLWYNFITTGKPIPDDRVITSEGTALPEWPAVGANRSPHMSLGVEIELQTTLLQKRTEFWDGIYSKYYKVPVPPPTPPPRPHSEL
uniref:Carboxylic ester hydrolase n=1 Tax=Ectropis obliqua TaxID=248899 RepID=A0A2U3T8K9_ECTOB|nr:putative antennal esterase CXE22 [Ectropis obliqua]